MEVITLFRRLLLAQVLLGILAFCMASESPGLMLVAGGLIALSWYIVEGPVGHPLPQWLVVCGGGAAAAWLIIDLPTMRSGFLVGVGYFTMALQILLLFSKKSNREYGEILVLSLMQLVGASVLSVSIIYGLMLAAYCGLGIFTLVVFQFKVTSDEIQQGARQVMPATTDLPPWRGAVGRGYRWQFRSTAGGLGLACCVIAAVVFVLAPRDDVQRAAEALIFNMQNREMGFTTHVDLKTPPDTSHDTEWVLHLTVSRDGRRIDGSRSFHLRGAALDHYEAGSATWSRWLPPSGGEPHGNVGAGVQLMDTPPNAHVLEGHVVMRMTPDNTLFAPAPVVWIRSDQLDAVFFNPFDQRLGGGGNPGVPVEYDFRSLDMDAGVRGNAAPGAPGAADADAVGSADPEVEATLRRGEADYLRTWYTDPEQIRQQALAIIHEAGLDRDPQTVIDPHDFQIAGVLANYLRTHYTYTLTRQAIRDSTDPIVDFLFNNQQGHCELFAAALTAMMRSIGITSRMVTGYLASEYSQVGGYYMVRQADAHAWAEVYCGASGWREVDATPAGSAGGHHFVRSRLAVFREIYDRIDFAWITAVVAFDGKTRANLLKTLGRMGASMADWQDQKFLWLAAVLEGLANSSGLVRLDMGFLVVMIAVALLVGGRMAQVHLARRRSMAALHIRHMPRAQRRVLVRRLGFYLQTVELLERYGLVRPFWQTPRAFAEAVVQDHGGRLGALTDLTDIFYEVRYGMRQVDDAVEARIRACNHELTEALRGRKRGRA